MKTLLVVLLFATACGPAALTPTGAAVDQCPASRAYPAVTAQSAGLDCGAVAFDFETAQDLLIRYGVASEEQIREALGAHVDVADTYEAAALEYSGGPIRLSRPGDNLMRQLINAFIYPTGWKWAHNPAGPDLALESYRDSFRQMGD